MTLVIRKSTPTPSDLHVNGPLTNLALAYIQGNVTYISREVFRTIPVQKQSDLFYKWHKKSFLSAYAKKRAPSTESAGGNLTLQTDSYAADVYAYHYDIDDQQRANADSQLNLEDSAQRHVSEALLREQERLWLANYFKTSVWATDVTGVASGATAGQFNQWDGSGSVPAGDIETAKVTILGSTGKIANTLILGRLVYSKLRTNPHVKDQFKYTSDRSVNLAMLAAYFDVDRVLISDMVATTNGSTFGLVAGKHALLTYVDPNPGLQTVSCGYTFNWSGYTGAQDGLRMSMFREEKIRSDRIEGEYAWAQKLTAADLGYFLSGAVA